MRFTPAVMAACIHILSDERRGFGRAETTTSISLKAEMRSDGDEKLTAIDLEAEGADFVESLRPMAVTVNPAVLRAVRILEPRLPVAYESC